MTWGRGKWPSLQFAMHRQMCNRIYGAGFPNQFDVFIAPYGQAFRYADLKWNGGKYAGSVPLALGLFATGAGDNAIVKYHEAVAQGAASLPFTFYVPRGFGIAGSRQIPNVEETNDPNLIFIVSFNNDEEVWRELRLSSIP